MAEVLPSDELVEEPSDYGSLTPGTRLGRYELLVPIARGGMARVWAARLHGQRGFQKLVAIKTILPHLAEEPEFERMFLDEARIASGVHHPNVCEIYELGEEKKTLYLVMEWVSGDSLARVLRRSGKTEALDPRVVARVVADACAGLHAAHELVDDDGRALAVVHRDLSPHNILLSADGVAKVADFGVAKALGQLHDATSAGQLKGKLAYMAPEQITGAAIDRRSDIFSLGVVLYEATTGQRPFKGDGDHQVMHAVLKGELPPPTMLLRGYPPELERIVMRALSPQPLLRFPTAERMRFALEEFLTKGQLVTQSNVAQVVRARIGEQIDRRRERIRQASNLGDTADDGRPQHWSEPPAGMTPSAAGPGREPRHDPHRSGVKPSGAHAAARPFYTTMPLDGQLAPATPPMVAAAMSPVSSATIPQAHPYAAPPNPSHTPASHPGASHPGAAMQVAMPAVQLPSLTPNPMHGASPAPPPVAPAYSLPPTSRGGAPLVDPGAAPERTSTPPAAGQYAIAIAVGVLLAAVIGGGGFYAWRVRRAPVAETHAPPSTAAPTPVPMGSIASPLPSDPDKSPEIAFVVAPSEAVLSVDGAPLPGGARAVPRPPVGKNVMVTARAPGHEDMTVSIDYFTSSPKTLALRRADVAAADAAVAAVDTPGEGTAGATTTTTTTKPAEKPKRPKPQGDPALPANPY